MKAPLLQFLADCRETLSQYCEALDSKSRIPGALHISHTERQVDYFYYNPRNTKKDQYLKKKDLPFIMALAQQEYEEDFSKASKDLIHAIDRCEEILGKSKDPGEVYENLRPERRLLVQETSPDDAYVEAWLKSHKAPPSYFDGNSPVILTDDGLRVRSKSEFMYVTVFKARGIPFVFEPKVVTRKGVRRPDFLVLNRRTKKEYYIEHFGKMDDPAYLKGTLEKLKEYGEIGIMLGDDLLASFETKDQPLDIEEINRLVDRFLV